MKKNNLEVRKIRVSYMNNVQNISAYSSKDKEQHYRPPLAGYVPGGAAGEK